MTDFKAKMHQIRFRLRGVYSAPPDTLTGFWGRFAAGEGLGWGRGGKEGGEREGGGSGGERKLLLNQGPSETCNATGIQGTIGTYGTLIGSHNYPIAPSVPITLSYLENRNVRGPVLPADIHMYAQTVWPTAINFSTVTHLEKGVCKGSGTTPNPRGGVF